MEYLLLCGGICLIFGFIIDLLAAKKTDILSCLADFVVYGKQHYKSDEAICKGIDTMLDIMLKGYNDLEQNPKATYEKLRQEKQETEEMKALIKAYQKLIKKTKNSIKKNY